MLKTIYKLNDGHGLPLIGFGTYLITGQSDIARVVDEALKAGYRSFDSAACYDNEVELGIALKQLLPKYNLTRKDIYITTKLWVDNHGGGAKTEDAVKTSLRNLQCDYVDLYLIHWPGVGGLAPSDPKNATVRRKTWSTLVKLQKEGLLRSVGVSNYTLKHIVELVKDCDGVKPAVNQMEWHPHNNDRALLEECRSQGILVQAYSPLGGNSTKAVLDDPDVISAAKQLGVSPGRVLLRWLVQQQIAIIPKSKSPSHIVENTQLDFVIPNEIMNKLSNSAIKRRYDWDPNTVV